MSDDLPVIHHCKKHTDVPAGEMILITPSLRLNSSENPVHQVVRAAMIEYRSKGRSMPREVWIWGSYVYIPKEAGDGQN